MMIGEVIEGCLVAWRDAPISELPGGVVRKIKNATVKHVGPNIIEFARKYNTRDNTQAMMKKLTVHHLLVRSPDGKDLVAAWRE